MSPQKNQIQEYPDSALSLQSFLLVVLAISVGMFAAALLLPAWTPNMASSLVGPDPKAYWYLSRGSAFVALSLLWLSMALGLLVTNKMARVWPGVPASFAIHEYVSLLGLGFALFHAVILIGDKYIHYSMAQILIPFASSYQPFWVGMGQLAFYAALILSASFYIRKQIGQNVWRLLHYASFLTYAAALIHGIAAGTDTSLLWVQKYYWYSAGSLLFLLIYRILTSSEKKKKRASAKAQNAGL